MIITTEEQEKIIEKWNTKEKSTRDFICFLDGMKALSKLLEDKEDLEKKEHLEKLRKLYDEKHQVESPK